MTPVWLCGRGLPVCHHDPSGPMPTSQPEEKSLNPLGSSEPRDPSCKHVSDLNMRVEPSNSVAYRLQAGIFQ